MSFLNGIFLIAIPLAAAPVVVHLLRRRQRQVVRWGAMQFLTDAVAKGRRFDRVEEWLLLALRTAAILALVLALARPLVSVFSSKPAAEAEIVLVIDDSLSTDRRVANGKVYDQILAKARQFIEARTGGESIYVMMAAEGPRWLTTTPSLGTASGKEQLIASLDETQPTRGKANFMACLRLASSFESPDENVARRVVVFTDSQSQGWQADAKSLWERLRTTNAQGERTVSFEVAAIKTEPAMGTNLSLDRVSASRLVAAEDESIVFTAKVRNVGQLDCPGATIAWSNGGKRQERTRIEPLSAGQTKLIEWRTSFKKRAVHEVSATIELDDELLLDNEDGVVVEVVESIPILVLSETNEQNDIENQFLAAALGYQDARHESERQSVVLSPWRSLYRPTFAQFGDLEKIDLGKYHAVVLSRPEDLPASEIDRLDAYVREGGGLWLILGPRVDRDTFNRRWFRDGVGLCPIPLASLVRPRDPNQSDAMIHPPSADHPATATLADTDRLDIDQVRLQRYHLFRRQQGNETQVLLESGRGAPLAMLHSVGKGRVVVQAFPLRTDWTDLAISKAFVVLVQDWLSYLTQPAATRFNLAAREPLVYHPHLGTEVEKVQVVLPDNSQTTLEPIDRDGEFLYRWTTSLPGRYELLLDGAVEKNLPFRVARDSTESDLAVLSSTDIAMLQETGGIRFGTFDTPAPAALTTKSRLEPAWWPLLIAMVCLMAGESLVATRISRGRFGDASRPA